MQQFTGQSTLWRVMNPLNTPTQPLKWDYSRFTDVDTDSVTADLKKLPHLLFQVQSAFSALKS